MTVTVLTPATPERLSTTLPRAAASVYAQTLAPAGHYVGIDYLGDGPAVTRNRLLESVSTEFVAFLDDDDELHPHHLEVLQRLAEESGAAVVYSCHDGAGAGLEHEFNHDELERRNYIPVTVLARTEAVLEVGGFPDLQAGEDWALWILMARAGFHFEWLPRVTWTYHRSTTGRHATRPTDAREEVLRHVG